jgi:hypothetical protein
MTEAENPPGETKLVTAKYVVYIGQFGVREIDEAAWDNVNVKDQKAIVWDRSNGWAVPVDSFTDDALKYVDEVDRDFVVRDVEISE